MCIYIHTTYTYLYSIHISSRCHRSLREASPSGGADLADLAGGGPLRCQFRQGRGAETTGASPCGWACGWAVRVGALVWRDMMMPPASNPNPNPNPNSNPNLNPNQVLGADMASFLPPAGTTAPSPVLVRVVLLTR